ncbi:hypothetical protein OXX79_000749 [Metschnikowia pulcherrima]
MVTLHKNELAFAACKEVLDKTIHFFDTTTTGVTKIWSGGGYCDKHLQQAFGSMAHCLKSLPTNKGIPAFLKVCKSYNVTMQDFVNAYTNASKFLVSPVIDSSTANKHSLYYLPIKLNQETLNDAYALTLRRYYTYNKANAFGMVLIGYWLLLVFFAGFLRLARAMFPQVMNSFHGKMSNAYKRHVTMPALGKQKVVARGRVFKVFGGIIPTRMETLYLAIWLVLVVLFTVTNFCYDAVSVFWLTKSEAYGRKVADRSGVMALYLIPQLILFAGRNNALQWISGWSFARFNTIHRWMARTTLILILIHALSMVFNNIGLDWNKLKNTSAYVQWGYLATVLSALMCFHSMSFFRKHCYELFVLSHNIMGVFFIVGTWLHVREAGFQSMMYAAAVIWGFDKFMRVVKMAQFGLKTAEIQLFGDDLLKIKIRRPANWKPYPFSYAFVYFIRPSSFWQSHPFTIVDSIVEENTISFYIKIKGGMTSSLYRYLSQQPGQKARIKCFVEGPYGNIASLHTYETVSFLASGNGIPGPYTSLVDLAGRFSQQKLKLYWVIRHWESIEWFMEELKSIRGFNVQVFVFVTQFDRSGANQQISKEAISQDGKSPEFAKAIEDTKMVLARDDENHDEKVAQIMSSLDFVEFRPGRPNLAEIIGNDVQESSGAIAFVACGCDNFTDNSRRLVIDNLTNGKRVDFYDTRELW